MSKDMKPITEVQFVPRKFNATEWAELNHNLTKDEWTELNQNLQGEIK